MAIFILYDGVDFTDANHLQNLLGKTANLNGPVEIRMLPTQGVPVPGNQDAVIAIWSESSRKNTALSTAAAEMAGANRLVQVAATNATVEAALPDVIPISESSRIITELQQPRFMPPANIPPDRLSSDQKIIMIMATIIFVVLLLIWIAPSDEHQYGDCGTSYTESGYPIEHCPDSYY